jgi:hypothetical protein
MRMGASGAMISRACREAAKHTPFLLFELGPRNAATEEELRKGRRKICPNLMPKNGPQTARISEREKLRVNSSSFPALDFGAQFHAQRKPGGSSHQVSHPYLPNHASTRLPCYIEANNPPNLSEKSSRNRRGTPLLIKRHKKGGNVRRKIQFSLPRKAIFGYRPR